MEIFIVIVPPQEYADRIAAFQRRFQCGDPLVGPHITVKAQCGLTQDLDWLPNVEKVCRSFPRFEMALGQPEMFFTNVLYLSINSPKIFDLHRQLVEAVGPTPEQIESYFELEAYVPHLTLGMLRPDLEEIRQSAEAELPAFAAFPVEFIRIYAQQETDGAFAILRDIPLAK